MTMKFKEILEKAEGEAITREEALQLFCETDKPVKLGITHLAPCSNCQEESQAFSAVTYVPFVYIARIGRSQESPCQWKRYSKA